MASVSQSSESSNINSKFSLPENLVITPGVYSARITDWRVIPMMFGAPKLLIQCEVSIDDGEIVTLPCFLNVKLNEQNEIQPPGRRSHLYKLLVALLPSDSRERDMDNLIGLRCRARVETSVRDENHRPKPLSEQFSVVRALEPESEVSETVPF